MMMADKLHYHIAEKISGSEFSRLDYLKKTLANVLQIKYGH